MFAIKITKSIDNTNNYIILQRDYYVAVGEY